MRKIIDVRLHGLALLTAPDIHKVDFVEHFLIQLVVQLGPFFLVVGRPGSAQQIIGLRFPGLQVPQGAVIQEAHVEFVADYTNNESTHLTLTVEASDNAAAFRPEGFNISSRPRVTATIDWTNVSPWTVDNTYLTPDLSAAIQEVVCRDGWTSGNAIVVMVEGTGIREAVSYDQTPADAPTLLVTYRD